MLGRDHSLFSGLAFIGGDALIAHVSHTPILGPANLLIGTFTAAGFGLLPDIDEPGSTISRKLGVVSRAVSKVCKTLAGGHRKLTHTIFFLGAVFIGIYFATRTPLGSAIVVGCATALCLRLILPKSIGRSLGILNLIVPIAVAFAVYHYHYGGPWLAYAAVLGAAFHIIGDALTTEGVPIIFPFSNYHVRMPILGHCDSWRERTVGTLMSLSIIILAILLIIVPASKNLKNHIPINDQTAVSKQIQTL